MREEPERYLTHDEALEIAAEIKITPGCEFESIGVAWAGGKPTPGYVVFYWPLCEDGNRKNYSMLVGSWLEWKNLKRIALAHEAKRQRQRERSARGVMQRLAAVQWQAPKPGKERQGNP
jgi:hypothetical protein